MTRGARFLGWVLLLALIVVGLLRLRLDVEVLNLLPQDIPAVKGLRVYQEHFANARELIITVQAPDADSAEAAARTIAETLREATNLIARVTWQPPWLESPGESAELMAYLWFNQPPDVFASLTNRLAPAAAAQTLTTVRAQLATSMSPGDIARLSYDPFGLTQLPSDIRGAGPGFGEGNELFASPDGTFRVLFVQANTDLSNYRHAVRWLDQVKTLVHSAHTHLSSERSRRRGPG